MHGLLLPPATSLLHLLLLLSSSSANASSRLRPCPPDEADLNSASRVRSTSSIVRGESAGVIILACRLLDGKWRASSLGKMSLISSLEKVHFITVCTVPCAKRMRVEASALKKFQHVLGVCVNAAAYLSELIHIHVNCSNGTYYVESLLIHLQFCCNFPRRSSPR